MLSYYSYLYCKWCCIRFFFLSSLSLSLCVVLKPFHFPASAMPFLRIYSLLSSSLIMYIPLHIWYCVCNYMLLVSCACVCVWMFCVYLFVYWFLIYPLCNLIWAYALPYIDYAAVHAAFFYSTFNVTCESPCRHFFSLPLPIRINFNGLWTKWYCRHHYYTSIAFI